MMKLFLSILFILFIQSSHADDVIDVMKYSKENNLSDPYHASSIMQRCAGLYLAYGRYLPSSMTEQKKKFGKFSEDLIVTAGVIMQSKNMTTQRENIKQMEKALLFYNEHYYKKIEKTQLSTGSIFKGQVMEELSFCNAILKKVYKK